MFVNEHQTPEERRAKYRLARELGLSVIDAQRYRDCHCPKMFRHLGLPVPDQKTRRKLLVRLENGGNLPVSKKPTCDNCYNNVLNGGIVPMYHCLEHDPGAGKDMTKFRDANGKDCPEWHKQVNIK